MPALRAYRVHALNGVPASRHRAQRLAVSQLETLRLVEAKSVARDHSQGGSEPGLRASLAAARAPGGCAPLAPCALCRSPALVVRLGTRGASVGGKLIVWRWQEVECGSTVRTRS